MMGSINFWKCNGCDCYCRLIVIGDEEPVECVAAGNEGIDVLWESAEEEELFPEGIK